ncbi:hypothetical protein JL101_036180 (plasmid) [Skermanella rosea]|uniref:hypothetical protein n=1 Tax=Skermanella rosea TaxID=1817965 RepID=UPI001933DA3A|nr:hypothetical protein [Skermanella rosea]UEM08194.1 hypothetical protein JL101_036180 [Skermanella rosea]
MQLLRKAADTPPVWDLGLATMSPAVIVLIACSTQPSTMTPAGYLVMSALCGALLVAFARSVSRILSRIDTTR